MVDRNRQQRQAQRIEPTSFEISPVHTSRSKNRQLGARFGTEDLEQGVIALRPSARTQLEALIA
jgi:hypothetical protein